MPRALALFLERRDWSKPASFGIPIGLVSTANINAVDSRPIGRENHLQSTPAIAQLSGSRLLRSSAAAHTDARAGRESVRGAISDNASTDGYMHKVMFIYPFWQVFW